MAQTNLSAEFNIDDTHYVRLTEWEQFNDGSGWSSFLKVSAGEFSCSGKKFYFKDPHKFLDDLIKCNHDLRGIAELKTEFEDEFLRFSFDGLGHVRITGLLCDYGALERYFRYGIAADQTFISGFIKSLQQVLSKLK